MPMRNNTKCGIFLIGALSLIMLSSLVFAGSSEDNIKISNDLLQDNNKLTNNIDEPINISKFALLAAYTYQDLDYHSNTVIIGTVKEILPPKWNTADGLQPVKTVDELNSSDLIYTDIIVSVDKYIKNPLPSNEVTVRVVGGTIGNVSMTSDYEPTFKFGENVLLYLNKDTYQDTKNIGVEHFAVTGHLQGKFALTDDGKAVRPDVTVSQDELLNTIKK